MRRPRLLVLGSWVVATALATLISAAGVSIVTRDVTSDHGRALAAADVVALLSAGAEAPSATAPSTTTAAAVTAAPPETPPPSVITPPVPPATAPRTTAPAGTSAATPSPSSTFTTRGGMITVACTGETIALVSARPDNGFQMQVRETGPALVVVGFVNGGSGDAAIAAACPTSTPVLVGDRLASPAVDHRDDHARDDKHDDEEDRRGASVPRREDSDRSGDRRGR